VVRLDLADFDRVQERFEFLEDIPPSTPLPRAPILPDRMPDRVR
jgi:hypothetical protein